MHVQDDRRRVLFYGLATGTCFRNCDQFLFLTRTGKRIIQGYLERTISLENRTPPNHRAYRARPSYITMVGNENQYILFGTGKEVIFIWKWEKMGDYFLLKPGYGQ